MDRLSEKITIQTRLLEKSNSKVIDTLRELGSVKKLATGEVLITQGGQRGVLYVIISGKIRIIQKVLNQFVTFARLNSGDWIGEPVFPLDSGKASSAVAEEESIVIKINEEIIKSLDQDVQLRFYRQLCQLYQLRENQYSALISGLEQKNTRLAKDLITQRCKAKTDFRQMEMIRGIIRKVPRLPIFATTLSSKLLEDKLSAGELAEKIMKDPSLVAIILKTINSAYYGFQKKISDIRYAIVLLGFDMIYQLVIAEGVKRTMPDTPAFNELHTHSVIISHLAFTLSQESKVGNPSEMATIGLLHGLGLTVIELLKERNPKFATFINQLDHAQMSALLLKAWNLPDIIWKSVEYQFYPEFSAPENIPVENLNNVTLLYLSHLCYEFLRGKQETELPITFMESYMRYLNFQGLSVRNIVEEKLLPVLGPKMKSFPVPVKQLLKRHIK